MPRDFGPSTSDFFTSVTRGALQEFTAVLRDRREEAREIRTDARKDASAESLQVKREELGRESDRQREDKRLEIQKAIELFRLDQSVDPGRAAAKLEQDIDKITQETQARDLSEEETVKRRAADPALISAQDATSRRQAEREGIIAGTKAKAIADTKGKTPEFLTNQDRENVILDMGGSVAAMPISDIYRTSFGTSVMPRSNATSVQGVPSEQGELRQTIALEAARKSTPPAGAPPGFPMPTIEETTLQGIMAQTTMDLLDPENANSPLNYTGVKAFLTNNVDAGITPEDAIELAHSLTDEAGNPIPIKNFVVPQAKGGGPHEQFITIDDIVDALFHSDANSGQVRAYLNKLGSAIAQAIAPKEAPPFSASGTGSDIRAGRGLVGR